MYIVWIYKQFNRHHIDLINNPEKGINIVWVYLIISK